jgi:hypothetical protein
MTLITRIITIVTIPASLVRIAGWRSSDPNGWWKVGQSPEHGPDNPTRRTCTVPSSLFLTDRVMIVIVGQSSVAVQRTDQIIESSSQQLSRGCRLTACKQSGDKVQGRHQMSHNKQDCGHDSRSLGYPRLPRRHLNSYMGVGFIKSHSA